MVNRFSIFRFTSAPFAAQLFFVLKQNIKSLETGYKINCSKKRDECSNNCPPVSRPKKSYIVAKFFNLSPQLVHLKLSRI